MRFSQARVAHEHCAGDFSFLSAVMQFEVVLLDCPSGRVVLEVELIHGLVANELRVLDPPVDACRVALGQFSVDPLF